MANLSSAFGDITITARTPQILSDFIHLHNISDANVSYETCMSDFEDLNKKDIQKKVKKEAIKQQNGNYYQITTPFHGTGRWNFRNNISWFFDLFKDDFSLKHRFDKNNLETIKTLKHERFTVIFDVTDSESGSDFIETYKKRITWNPDKQDLVEINEDDYDCVNYTAENLIDKGIYETGEVWDTEYIINNYDYFLEEVLESSNNIASYYQKTKILIDQILNHKEAFKKYLDDQDDNSGVYYELEEWIDEMNNDNELTKFFNKIN